MEYAITWYPVHGMSESGPVEHEFTKCSLPTPSITFPGGIEFTCDGQKIYLIGGSFIIESE
jgi:hypothetical protein